MTTTELIKVLEDEDLTFLTGVPCSYLENLLLCVNDTPSPLQHILACSEGEAVGIAAGYHLASQKVPIVYLQNSGLGNAVNPLTSLMDEEVYSIPAILFLSWRGEPGKPDEPQHKKMGHIMLDLLNDMGIPYEFASSDIHETAATIGNLKQQAVTKQRPVAIIFRPNLIDKPEKIAQNTHRNYMKREEILSVLLPKIGASPIVSTTGKTSRELFELREQRKQSHKYDFLTVGSMGCASGIGLGIAETITKQVFVIDGDGAALMKMGTLATIGHYRPKNFIHIVIDNAAYESTGSQPTASASVDWPKIFQGANYKNIISVKTKSELEKLEIKTIEGPCAIVIYAQTGSRPDLGRPTSSPLENKNEFMQFLQGE